MEAVLTRLKNLSADELREEFARANLKCGPITPTTRATFERKLARVLTNSETEGSYLDNSSSDHVQRVPSTCATSTVTTPVAVGEEMDFGYGVGLNPPDEEEMSIKTLSDSSAEHNIPYLRTHTPSVPVQTSPTFYYGVCPLGEDVFARNEGVHVYTNKKDALQAVKMRKGARFKGFVNREDAEKFAQGIWDCFPSPSKSVPCVSPVKPGLVPSKENMEIDAINRERANSFKSPRTQDLTSKLRKSVEKGDETAFFELIGSNPRYLIGSGDNPTIVQEGCRYNVMHVAAKENQAGIAQLLLDTLENPEFMRLMYPDDQDAMLQKRIRYIVDLYLNTPDKAGFETPLHFACKFGCPDVVNVLCTHPDIDKNCKNKDGLMPIELICSRKNKTPEVKQKILDYLEDRCYVPVLRATDNTSQPIIGTPWLPETSESHSLFQPHARSPVDPMMTVTAFAGPLSPSKAESFRRSWKTPPRDRAELFHNILKSDPDRGVERVGRDLAHEMGHPWAEYWNFLEGFVDLSSAEGLQKLEEYLSKKDLSSWTHEETGENETRNRFRTPSPGKPKKFCNSISIGAFLDETDDISREQMKNRQNTVLTSITSSAASKDALKGAVGGCDFHIHHHGPDLIETAAEQDLLCCCNDSLLSSGVVCPNQDCVSTRDGTQNVDGRSSSSSLSSSSCLLSPVSNLLKEFECMSLQEPLDDSASIAERKNKDLWEPDCSPLTSDPDCGLDSTSSGRSSREYETADRSNCKTNGARTEERLANSSPEEYFDAEDTAEVSAHATEMQKTCTRCTSWDQGTRDLSSSGSSGSSFKSLDNSCEPLPRTPHLAKALFIDGNSPSKLDREVLSAIGKVNIDPLKFPLIHQWKSTMKLYSTSDMQSWRSPAGVKSQFRMLPHTPSSPISGLKSPTARFSPVRQAASPDYSTGRYSPANVSYIQRIRLKHLNELAV